MEKQINENIDQFLTYFFISYSNYKDELLATQRKMVDDLSVPIIPINREICILPLIGTIDLLRLATIQDKVLTEIENHHIRSLIIDLSGVTPMEQDATNRLIKIIEGISMMGCETFLTGLRAEIVKNLINIGVGFNPLAKFKGNLRKPLMMLLMILNERVNINIGRLEKDKSKRRSFSMDLHMFNRKDKDEKENLASILENSKEVEENLMRTYLITAERIHDNEELKERLENFAEGNAKRTKQLIDELNEINNSPTE